MFRTMLTRGGIAAALVAALAACTDNQTLPTDRAATDDPVLRFANRGFLQIDRFGKPAIATVFIASSKKDAFNTAVPANDVADYSADVIAVLTKFGHPNPPALAAALLPDVQPFNTQSTAGFLNGRKLADDVITAELGLIFGSNPALNDDHVDANDVPLLSTFPYLAAPQR
jgi:Domain of unknown function (DUF4331)